MHKTCSLPLYRYGIEISNNAGRTEGHINLIVHKFHDKAQCHSGEENGHKSEIIRSNPVKRENFGEYVARMHALNNKGFINQFQVNYYMSMYCLNT